MTGPTLDRRNFLRLSAMTAVLAAVRTTPLHAALPLPQSATQDLEILNYALALEHLEARAYAVANQSGLVTGKAAEYFRAFGDHEAAHVDALTKTISDLGGTPVKAQESYNFPAFKSEREVLEYFQTVEELGAAAYLGQAPRLMNPDLLTAAVSIHNVEGQHAAVLSDLIGVSPSPQFASPKTMDEVLAVVTPIMMASGAMPAAMPQTGRGGRALSKHLGSGLGR